MGVWKYAYEERVYGSIWGMRNGSTEVWGMNRCDMELWQYGV